MGYDIRFPKITGTTEREQLVQIKSYLHQLVEQLQWAFNDIDVSKGAVVTTTPKSTAVTTPPKSAYLTNTTSIDAQATFDAIKALIIKSADIVNAYYEEINTRIESIYVAESDFGTYMEQTSQDISKNSTDIKQSFSHIQQILSDIENIEYTLIETNAHIRSGLLYYDSNEIPVYGVEIGQRNNVDGVEVFNKYARFTADRLSFYDRNNTEVAYISDRKLHISNVEVLVSIKRGGLVETVLSNGDTVERWVGRG